VYLCVFVFCVRVCACVCLRACVCVCMRTGLKTEKTDVYAMGVVLWELWVMKTPYAGLKVNDIAARVRGGERPVLPDDADPPAAGTQFTYVTGTKVQLLMQLTRPHRTAAAGPQFTYVTGTKVQLLTQPTRPHQTTPPSAKSCRSAGMRMQRVGRQPEISDSALLRCLPRLPKCPADTTRNSRELGEIGCYRVRASSY
jgi:hypothetical protein